MQARLRLLWYFVLPMLGISSILRLAILTKELLQDSQNFFSVIIVLLNGVLNDLLTVSLALPLFILLLWPARNQRRFYFYVLAFFIVLNNAFWGWTAICEWFFWDEFSTRLNFIAVDYLIYTKEVVGNIKESFSLPMIVSLFTIGMIALCTPLLISLKRTYRSLETKPIYRDPVNAVLLLAILAYVLTPFELITGNNIQEDLTKNGVYEFFSAFRHNEIDYKKHYANIDEAQARELIRQDWESTDVEVQSNDLGDFYKNPKKPKAQEKYNLIFVAVESFGAKFIGPLGNTENLTPYYNALIKESLFFSNIYATGTRTVRGLEALSLSLPPTPGASIVRRPKNDNLMSIGMVFQDLGYETKFIYGGHGLFDNMNSFFQVNNYEIVDRTNFTNDEITFSNVWGVADENLFDKTIKEADKSFAHQKPFFSMVLTTSNHRPFTYPDGKIDIPSHTSRAGAVKYTDYSIGKFIEKARTKPWFKNTFFVIVADHSTEGRGKIDIPVDTYHIPFLIYAPAHVKPVYVERVASQIDVIPTVLNQMGVRENNLFFGRDIMAMSEADERFFVGTYQKVGFYKNKTFVTLGPKREIITYEYDPKTKKTGQIISNPELEKLAVANYQYASYLFKKQLFNKKSLKPKN
jgi:phosphoglycerol transferase MdoB-like AlkP superfamily enzyme